MGVNSRAVPHLRVVNSGASELSDAMLGAAWAMGEPWAAEAVWKRYAPLVFSLLQTGLGAAAPAEALTRRVFSEAFRSSEREQRAGSLPRLLVRCAARTLRSELSRRRLLRWLGFRSRIEPVAAVSGRLTAHAELVLNRLYEVLDQLGPSQRTLFVLFELEGYSIAEIGAALGFSTAATERKVRAASDRFQHFAAGDPLLSEYLQEEESVALDVREGA